MDFQHVYDLKMKEKNSTVGEQSTSKILPLSMKTKVSAYSNFEPAGQQIKAIWIALRDKTLDFGDVTVLKWVKITMM